MKKYRRPAANEFAICDEPIPLPAWQGKDGEDHLSMIEQDIRGLIRELAVARFDAAEQERDHRNRTRDLLLALAEVHDAYGRVFANIQSKQSLVTSQMKKWIANFRTVQRLLDKVLTEQGIARIESVDQEFSPAWHQAVEVVTDPEKPVGTVVEEVAAGYLWHGELLRRAEVAVVGDVATASANDSLPQWDG